MLTCSTYFSLHLLRKKAFFVLYFSLILISISSSLEAIYIKRKSVTVNGGIAFTGNTLGLSKADNQNQPGTRDSIGAFITTNPNSRVGNYPSTSDPLPAGTTLDYKQNSSQAFLDLPENSQVKYAELIWSGSYGWGNTIPLNPPTILNSSVTLTTPVRKTTISPDPTTAQNVDTPKFVAQGSYVRSQDVTKYIQEGGSGLYTVGGVPATVAPSDESHNAAGWTLAVIYENPLMETSNLTIFVGCELASYSNNAVEVSGFCAPPSGPLNGRLFVSAIEGDATILNDQLLFGSKAVLDPRYDALSGVNNLRTNFFASQINTKLPLEPDPTTGKLRATGSSQIDERGSYGKVNADPVAGKNIPGGRQGYDITSIDISNKLSHNQTVAYALGTTTGDDYVINALGLQIAIGAPLIVASKQVNGETTGVTAQLDDILNFRIELANQGTADAFNAILKDPLTEELILVPGSVTLNGVEVLDADLSQGLSIGTLTTSGNNSTAVVEFQASLKQYPKTYDRIFNAANIDYWFVSCQGSGEETELIAQTNTVFIAVLPIAHDDVGKTSVNQPLKGASVLNNDVGNGLTVIEYTQGVQGGIVVVNADGTYDYTPPHNFVGEDAFTYTAQDSSGNQVTATVTIEVVLDVFPIARPDFGTTVANTPLQGNVLENDEGIELEVVNYSTQSSQGGEVSVEANGDYVYTPPLNFAGKDVFDYTVKDHFNNTASSTVTITVTPFPITLHPDVGTTVANTPLQGNVLENDEGIELEVVNYSTQSSQGGEVSVEANGDYVYTPPLNFAGEDVFDYTVKDHFGNTASSTVTITVTPFPITLHPDVGTTVANTPLQGNVLKNDEGIELKVVNYSTQSSQGGEVSIQPNGDYVYTPPLNFAGEDVFDYTVKDHFGNTASSTVTITVTPFPITLHPDVGTTVANTPLLGNVLENDEGIELEVVNYSRQSSQGGKVKIEPNGDYVYTPPLNFAGEDVFDYTVKDHFGNSASSIVTITVTPFPITLHPDVGTTVANTPLQGNVLENDEGIELEVVNYTQGSQGGKVKIEPNGDYVYTPPLNFAGEDVFDYTVKDHFGNSASSIVTITVTPFPITLHPDVGTTVANTPLQGNVLENDEGIELEVVNYTQGSQGGKVKIEPNGDYVYTSPLNFAGEDVFDYTVKDHFGNSASSIVTITVTPFPITLHPDVGTTVANTPLQGNVLENDEGIELKVVNYSRQSSQGGEVSIQSNGDYVYTPPLNFAGEDVFDYTVRDHFNNTASSTVTITVTPFPITLHPDVGTTVANAPLTGNVLENDEGIELKVVNYTQSSQGGEVSIQSNGDYVYTPPLNFAGEDVFDYTVQDHFDNTASSTVTITVTPFPITLHPDVGTTVANTPLTGNVLENDEGIELKVVNYSRQSSQGGKVKIEPNGDYVYTPPLNFAGEDVFDYTVQDHFGNSASSTVTITVTPFPITLHPDVGTTVANTPLQGNVLENDEGIELKVVNYSRQSSQGGEVSIQSNGDYVYTPPLNFAGEDVFDYTVRDHFNNTASSTVTITVTPFPITLHPDVGTTVANTPLTGNVLENDEGIELKVVNYTQSSQGGEVSIQPNGDYVYTPPLNFAGKDVFDYTVQDHFGNSASSTVTITVTPFPITLHPDVGTTVANTPLLGNVLENDEGIELEVVDYTQGSQGGKVKIEPNGDYVYTPPLNFAGKDSFEYFVRDHFDNTASSTVTITVTPYPPPIVSPAFGTTPKNTPFAGTSVLIGSEGINLSVINYSQGVRGGAVAMKPDGTYRYIPPFNFVGKEEFTYLAQDAFGQQVSEKVTITVTDVPSLPLLPLTPRAFKGVIKKCEALNRTEYFLKATWKSPSPDVVFYKIYHHKKVVKHISAKHSLVYEKYLGSHPSAKGYTISAVYPDGVESERVKLRITHE